MRVHNPCVPNPFFNVFDADFFRDKETCVSAPWKEKYEADFPRDVLTPGVPFAFDQFEPYYGFYYHLFELGAKFLYLQGVERPDLATLLLDHTRQPFLLHAWFGRYYGHEERQTKRIDAIYREALTLRRKVAGQAVR